ncbi:UDP-N-acetylglucosamine 2-epimerase [Brevibacillus massiliensis]|jgi:UDP-N-acetylglucosamine 2-epimerase (non-hydrolysing)/GDP/UDP-N,N'-diacetylbacillosamine 2-epimerase (hydrolysing)|uniref:UDP-N-acetylglucosamine 2-epimerase n=1 Tax=Brevibacillus massiliensis TaxID=1118054 RepID=UPI0002F02533|nr:UDP-N-acetylglucosamine 2-epimerase [Brevibacillus massiliensis]
MKRKICVVTGTRAEYGLLYWLMREIENIPDFELQIAVTGAHLSPEYGFTYRDIENDGFFINERIEMLLSSDSCVGVTKSVGLATIGFADAFDRLKPDLVVILGDRYEMLAAAQAALIAKIPIAHIAGGDTTEGAFDEAIRHSITKMSHIHFVTNEDAARRVRQMGENPKHIFNVGSMGIDHIRRLRLIERNDLEKELDFKFREKNLLVTYHPVTLELNSDSLHQFQELLNALDGLGNQYGLIFTRPNADPCGKAINVLLDKFVATHENARAYTSLGQLRYLSTIAQVNAVVGNSSSGLYEVPSFKIPTVNIGDRQKGRLQATSVINCEPRTDSILRAIREAMEKKCFDTVNPYGDGHSTERIIEILQSYSNFSGLLRKKFFGVECL